SIPGDSTTFLDNFVYNEELRTRGNGYTFKIGFIYRATDFLRLGGAVHTPTYYDLQDEWATDITSNFNDGFSETALSPVGEFDYAITSPFRAQGSIAYIIGKQGLLSAEYEFIDYASARLRSDDANFDVANDVVRNSYRATGNLKIGGEWRLKPFALRAGFAHFGSPYDDGANNDGSLRSYTFGAGYRQSEFFIDLAYVYTRKEENLFLYDPSLIESSNITYTNHNVQLTVGIRL
ncbi:MAG: hypothetical protein AAGB22_10080, partial [Bacteroidota bacterium]